jgi:ABC-type transporter Mla maintaining outer membrane lipid asymmetry permease subunit MlaE
VSIFYFHGIPLNCILLMRLNAYLGLVRLASTQYGVRCGPVPGGVGSAICCSVSNTVLYVSIYTSLMCNLALQFLHIW